MDSLLLPLLILFPIAVSLILAALPHDFNPVALKGIGTFGFLGSIALVLSALFLHFSSGYSNTFEFTVSYLPQTQQSFSLQLDGLSGVLLILAGLLPLAVQIGLINNERNPSRGMIFHLFLLQAFLFGVFLASDLISFYIFWEAALIPMYFIIGIWGGENRVQANTIFFIFTLVGSLLLLVGIFFIGSFAAEIANDPNVGFVSDFGQLAVLLAGTTIPIWVFFFIFIGFGIKAAIFPLHAWLPQTYLQTPIAGLVILSGVMAKMGTYGMMRFGFTFMENSVDDHAVFLSIMATIGILYAAWIAYTRFNLKEVVAFSSMSHMGFIILGIVAGTAQSMQGAAIQMLNHGVSTGAIFIMIGYLTVRYKQYNEVSGLAPTTPILASLFMIAMLSSIGLPGLNGFIGEFNILIGSFISSTVPVAVTVLAAVGVILAAVYMLVPYRRLFFGQEGEFNSHFRDLSFSEVLGLAPLLVMIIWVGVAPGLFFDFMEQSINYLLQ